MAQVEVDLAAAALRRATSHKLAPPTAPEFAVERPRLLRRLVHGLGEHLTLIVGPAGSGKSVLLAQWHGAQEDRQVAWLSVDSLDDDPSRLGHDLVAALDRVRPGFGADALAHLTTDFHMGEEFEHALCAEAAELPACVLVVQDLHLMRSRLLLAQLGGLIERLPPTVKVIVATRADPPFPLHRLRARGALTEIRQNDLAFDETEARELLRRIESRQPTDTEVSVLVDRTEGWAAGLHLAALSLRDAGDSDVFLQTFSGDDRNVADFLTGEILDLCPYATRQFLLRTSVLRRLCAPLCDALTGGGDAGLMLEEVQRRTAFLVPLDNRRKWFRYHHLFGQVLRSVLRSTNPGLEHTLLVDAGAWLVEHGDVEQGVEYLLEARQWDEVMDLVLLHGARYYEQSDLATPIRWLEAVPASARGRRPRVGLALAMLHRLAGNGLTADAMLAGLERKNALDRGHAAVADLIRVAGPQWHRPPTQALAAADRAMAAADGLGAHALPDVLGMTAPALFRQLVCRSRGQALALHGRHTEAFEALEAAAGMPGASYPPFTIISLGSLAWIAAECGRLTEAEGLAERGLAYAEETGLAQHMVTAEHHLALARVARERNQLDLAHSYLDEALFRARPNRRATLAALVRAERVHVLLAEGRDAEAVELLQFREGVVGPPPLLSARLAAAEALVHLRLGEHDKAVAVLQGAPPLLDVTLVGVAVATSRRDLETAAKLLAQWPSGPEPLAGLTQRLWRAVVEDLEGDRAAARELLAEVVARAEPEAMVRVFVEAADDAGRMLRSLYNHDPRPYLRTLVEVRPSPPLRRDAHGLVEQLSARELIVLRYLPSTLTNQEIAGRLFVSVNTLKTHLKHIYRKLNVTGRREAVTCAEELGLV